MTQEDMKFFLAPSTNENGELIIRTGTARNELPLHNYQGFQYNAHSVQSFVDLVKEKSSGTDRCVIFYNESGFFAILDDTVKDRNHDTVAYNFCNSVLFQEWAQIVTKGMVFEIKSFSDFLKRREPDEVDDIDSLLYAVQNFRYVTNVQGDFSFEDRNNYTFNIKVDEAESTVRVPKILVVSMEIFKDSGYFQDIEIEIEVHRPKSQEERPGFYLSCPKYKRYLDRAKQHECDRLPDLLPGYLIASGQC